MRIDRTLKARVVVVSVHPKVIGIASKLILRAIETVMLAEVLRGKKANRGGRNVMAWDKNVHVLSVLADEGPAGDAGACEGSGAVDSLNLANVSGVISEEVAPIGVDRKSASGVKNDVVDVVSGLAREQRSDEVGTGNVSVEGER